MTPKRDRRPGQDIYEEEEEEAKQSVAEQMHALLEYVLYVHVTYSSQILFVLWNATELHRDKDKNTFLVLAAPRVALSVIGRRCELAASEKLKPSQLELGSRQKATLLANKNFSRCWSYFQPTAPGLNIHSNTLLDEGRKGGGEIKRRPILSLFAG